jgi:RimJ/RimL family protein N-acetyltransferase
MPHETQPVIRTERLDLHHLAADDLLRLHTNPEDKSIYLDNGYRNPHRVLMDAPSPVRWRVPQVLDDASVNKWFFRWMVERDSKVIVGSLSFHGPPDQQGMLEIGLSVHEKFQRKGYGREALIGMWMWASEQPGVKLFRYTVGPHNTASVELVRGMGFTYVGQQIDEEDGPEDIYEMSVEDFCHRNLL